MKKITALALTVVLVMALFAAGVNAASVKQCNYDAGTTTGDDYYFRGWVIVEGDTVVDVGYRIDDEAPVFSVADNRPDVSDYFGIDPSVVGGFDFHLKPEDLTEGEHIIHVVVKTSDGSVLDINNTTDDGYTLLGTKKVEPAEQSSSLNAKNFDQASAADGVGHGYGWAKIENGTIGVFGYRIDDGEPVFDEAFQFDREDVWSYFGVDKSVANGFDITADISKVPAGEHQITFVVKASDGNVFDMGHLDFTSTYEGEPEPQQPEQPNNPGTADAAVIAIAAVACIALAGIVVAKKVK